MDQSFTERLRTWFNSQFIRTHAATRPDEDQRNPPSNATECVSPAHRPSGDIVTLPIISERSSSNAALDIERAPPAINNEIESDSISAHSRTQSNSIPVCLICLETLASDDFASGRAISLECKCRGELALRHRDCAVKWAQVKDDGRGGVPICELCKHPVRNLPPLPPRPLVHLDPETGIPLSEEAYNAAAAAAAADQPSFPSFGPPSTADLVFDCIRVTWVAMIVSILFFEASLASALWTGLIAGIAYSMMVRVMYRQHFEAVLAYREQQAAFRSQQQSSFGAVVPPRVPS